MRAIIGRTRIDLNPTSIEVIAKTNAAFGLDASSDRASFNFPTGLVHNESLSEFITEVFVKSAKPDGVLEDTAAGSLAFP
jgi:hypothetical protein